MTYELCKQLKDAGFPMPEHDWDNDSGFCHKYCDSIGYDFCCPTLSELISACGDEFGSLERTCNYLGKTLEWCATQTNIDGKDLYRIGSTPEEAVARLWLALNKK